MRLQSLNLNLFPLVLCPTHCNALFLQELGRVFFFPNSEHFGPALEALAEFCRMAFRLFNAKNLSPGTKSFPVSQLGPHSWVYSISFILLVITALQRGCRGRLCFSPSSRALWTWSLPESKAQGSCRMMFSPCGGLGWAATPELCQSWC